MLMAVLNCLFDSLSQMLRWAVHSWHLFGRDCHILQAQGFVGNQQRLRRSWAYYFRVVRTDREDWMERRDVPLWNNSPVKGGWEGAESLLLCLLYSPCLCQNSKHPQSAFLGFILYIRGRERASIEKCPRRNIHTLGMEAMLPIVLF